MCGAIPCLWLFNGRHVPVFRHLYVYPRASKHVSTLAAATAAAALQTLLCMPKVKAIRQQDITISNHMLVIDMTSELWELAS
jgi:hypothetical protein